MTPMEAATKACAALGTEAERIAFLDGYGHGLRTESATWKHALAAGSRRAKTAQPVECEASQSGPKGNAQNPPSNIGAA